MRPVPATRHTKRGAIETIRIVFAAVASGAAALTWGLASPAAAAADNQYYIPVCTGNDIPMNSGCRVGGPQGTITTPSLTNPDRPSVA